MDIKSIVAALVLISASAIGSAYAADPHPANVDSASAPATEGYTTLAGIPAEALSGEEMSEVQGAYISSYSTLFSGTYGIETVPLPELK